MKNVQMKLDGSILTITVDLSKTQGVSASGKSEIIATTSGNADVPGAAKGTKIGLNIYNAR